MKQTQILKAMTNAESILASATEKNANGELNSWESEFVSQFEGYTKKQLKSLSANQYKTLRSIANS